jgi:hypothetical protein
MYNSSTAEAATSVIAYRDSLRRGARAVVGPPYSSIAKYLALLGGIDQVRMCGYPILSSYPAYPGHSYPGHSYPGHSYPGHSYPVLVVGYIDSWYHALHVLTNPTTGTDVQLLGVRTEPLGSRLLWKYLPVGRDSDPGAARDDQGPRLDQCRRDTHIRRLRHRLRRGPPQ